MVAGLGDFVRNAPDPHTNQDREALTATNIPLNNNISVCDVSRKVTYSISAAFANTAMLLPKPPGMSRAGYFDSTPGKDQTIPRVTTPIAKPLTPSELPAQASPESKQAKGHGQRSSREIVENATQAGQRLGPDGSDRTTYQSAAEIMCQSLCIDEVAFLDMSVGTFAGLVQSPESTTEDSSMNSDFAQYYANSDDLELTRC